MDPRGVSPYEMSDFSDIEERDLRALLNGQVPSGDRRLGDVAAFLRDLETAVPEPSTSHCEAQHLTAMFEQAHLLAEKGEPAAMPASKADGPDDQVSGLPKPRRKTMLDKLKASPMFAKVKGASLAARIAAVTAAFMVLFSGMAFAGALPGPLQGATADALQVAGIDLPGGSDEVVAPAVGELDDADEVEDADDALGIEADDDADDAEDANGEADEVEDADADDEAERVDDDADDADEADEAAEAEDAEDDSDDADEAEDAEDDSDDDSADSDDSEDDAADSED